MTRPELLERAKRQLSLGPESEIELGACVMQASEALARKAMRDDALRGLLQQEYPVTLNASGEGNLLTAIGSVTGVAGEILLDGLHYGVVLDAEGQKLHPLRHYADFLAPQSNVFGYYLQKDGGTILTRARDVQVNTSFDIQSATGPLTITASYTPASVDNFKRELEPFLVQELCAIFATKANANA